MAPLSYYYSLSLILAGLGIYLLANFLSLKFLGTMVFGRVYKTNTPEYKRMLAQASNKAFVISSILNVIFIANLVLSIIIVINSNWPDKYGLLISMPIVVIFMFFIGIAVQRNHYKVDDDDIDEKSDNDEDESRTI